MIDFYFWTTPNGYKVEVIDFTHELLAKKYRKGREQEFDIVGKTHVEAFYWAMFTR